VAEHQPTATTPVSDPITAYVGVGSNIDPSDNVVRAVDLLSERSRITGVSTFYRTIAIGVEGAPDFFNGVVRLAFEGAAEAVESMLEEIEAEIGRERTADRYSARVIDLDLLLWFGNTASPGSTASPGNTGSPGNAAAPGSTGSPGNTASPGNTGSVTSHPDVSSRAFVALPLLELAPGLVLPGGESLARVAGRFRPLDHPLHRLSAALQSRVRPLSEAP